MIAKIRKDFRIKRAKEEFENRQRLNQRIATYEHKKMIEVSKHLRVKLKQASNFSTDDYFNILLQSRKPQKIDRTIYAMMIKKHEEDKKEGVLNFVRPGFKKNNFR